MDIILVFIGLVLVIFSAYCLGHWFGYGKGEADTLERVKHIRWLDGLGYTAESYKEHKKGNPVSAGLITGDGEFILRLLHTITHIYKCPPGYEDTWQKLRDLKLIEYHSSMLDGGFRPSAEGYKELGKISKSFLNGEIGRVYRRDPIY